MYHMKVVKSVVDKHLNSDMFGVVFVMDMK